ncbi:uncharacterized protein LOC128213220 [Mya arenaria]|uniref:uncharacterized protein LOC128213220 n=1 Tax=Mya arenaria TaxID=6604 RepID=UPI0022E2290F|nr:uncharacterized protein LOC128213220 [Mya arenaria]
MKQLYLQAGCDPFKERVTGLNSSTSNSLLSYIIRGCSLINDTSFPVYVDIVESERNKTSEETDSGAVLYIVAVLVFYSAGIIVMIIKYLRREQRELEEERILEDFFRSMPAYKKEREQNNVNRVAIHAFHALTSFSYDEGEDDVYSSDGEEELPPCAETIEEEEGEHHESREFSQFPMSLNKSLEDLDIAYSRGSDAQLTDLVDTTNSSSELSGSNLEKETHL